MGPDTPSHPSPALPVQASSPTPQQLLDYLGKCDYPEPPPNQQFPYPSTNRFPEMRIPRDLGKSLQLLSTYNSPKEPRLPRNTPPQQWLTIILARIAIYSAKNSTAAEPHYPDGFVSIKTIQKWFEKDLPHRQSNRWYDIRQKNNRFSALSLRLRDVATIWINSPPTAVKMTFRNPIPSETPSDSDSSQYLQSLEVLRITLFHERIFSHYILPIPLARQTLCIVAHQQFNSVSSGEAVPNTIDDFEIEWAKKNRRTADRVIVLNPTAIDYKPGHSVIAPCYTATYDEYVRTGGYVSSVRTRGEEGIDANRDYLNSFAPDHGEGLNLDYLDGLFMGLVMPVELITVFMTIDGVIVLLNRKLGTQDECVKGRLINLSSGMIDANRDCCSETGVVDLAASCRRLLEDGVPTTFRLAKVTPLRFGVSPDRCRYYLFAIALIPFSERFITEGRDLASEPKGTRSIHHLECFPPSSEELRSNLTRISDLHEKAALQVALMHIGEGKCGSQEEHSITLVQHPTIDVLAN